MQAAAFLLFGLALLVAGAELLVHFSSQLGRHHGLRPVIIGTTIVAFGTSAPEFLVSFLAAGQGNAGLAIGNAVGSNITNIALVLVLGLSALVSPLPAKRGLVGLEYLAALGASVLLVALAWDGGLSAFEGLLLCLSFGLFFVICLRRALRSRQMEPFAFGTSRLPTPAGGCRGPGRPGRPGLAGCAQP